MEKEFVSYEQAVALKELGFDDKCIATIENNGYVHIKGTRGLPSAAAVVNKVDAPLKQQVFRWFREYYWWYANLSSWLQEEEGTYHEYEIYDTPDSAHGSIMFKTYEEAENACIDKLILIAKQQDNGR